MKVLMCNSFFYLRGGVERCFFDLISLLEAHGHKVIPFSMKDKRNQHSEYECYFVSHVDFPSHLITSNGLGTRLKLAERVLYSREARTKIKALIESSRPDIAHIHGIAHELSPAILPPIKRAGIPIVQTLHDYKLLCPNTSFVSQGKICERCKEHRYYNVVRYRCKRDSLSASLLAGMEMYFHKLLQIYEDNVDLFITPSQFLQRKVAEYGITNPIIHLPNFVDIESFQPYYEPENHFVFYGRLARIKGLETLLDAMKLLDASHLYVAGEGEQKTSFYRYARENQITNVTFLGYLNKNDLIPIVQRAASTIVPSEWYENYSMTVLESFACGTPVIGSNIGGIPEMIIDGWNGLLFEPGNANQLADKMRSLHQDPQKSVVLGKNARQFVEKINHPERYYRQILEIYQKL